MIRWLVILAISNGLFGQNTVVRGKTSLGGKTIAGGIGQIILSTTATPTQYLIDNNWSGTATLLVSESNTLSGGLLSSVVIDVNGSLFTGSNLSTRSSCYVDPGDSTHHWCVIGTRLTQQGNDSNFYSRALKANTQHYYQIVIGGVAQSICPEGGSLCTFYTSNIPSNETWNEFPEGDSNGNAILPTIPDTRNFDFIDPKTGASIRNLFVSTDSPGTPNLYSGANKHICSSTLVGPGPGYLCSIATDNGGNTLYYVIPTTREIRYLGRQTGSQSWPTCNKPGTGELDDTNPLYSYSLADYKTGGIGCPGITVPVVVRMHYDDVTFSAATPNADCICTFDLLTPDPNNSLLQLMNAYDNTFDITRFVTPALDDVFKNKYSLIEFRSGIQGSDTWFSVLYLGDGQPLGSCSDCMRFVAGYYGAVNPKSRWTGSHSGTMLSNGSITYNVPGGFEGDTQGGAGAAPYLGPYASVIVGAIDNSQTTITVNKQPRSMSDATVSPYLQDIHVGDIGTICPATTLSGAMNNSQTTLPLVDGSWTTSGMRIDIPPEAGGNTEEIVTITANEGTNNPTVTRGSGSTNLSAHSSGVNAGVLYNDCGVFNSGQIESFTITNVSGLPTGVGGGSGTLGIARNTPSSGHGALAFTNGANLIFRGGPFIDGPHYIWWSFLSDPHGSGSGLINETNQDFWNQHGDFGGPTLGPNVYNTESYHSRSGDIVTEINQATTLQISPTVAYNGIAQSVFGNSVSRYPVSDKSSATLADQGWYLDFPGMISVGSGVSTLVPGKTQIYKVTGITLHRKLLPTFATSGGQVLTDVSAPSSVMVDGSGGKYKYCVSNVNDECVTGSLAGDIYINVPGLTNGDCANNEGWANHSVIDVCISDAAMSMGVMMQYSLNPSVTGYARRLSSGISTYGVRLNKELAKSTPTGEQIFFRSQPTTMFMLDAKSVPWITTKDGFDRTQYIPVSVTLPLSGTSIPVGTSRAVIAFGYGENGGNCTTRNESCVSVNVGSIGSPPFFYASTDSYTRASCSSGCTIVVPGMSSRTLIMTAKFYDVGGGLLRSDTVKPIGVAPAGYFSH